MDQPPEITEIDGNSDDDLSSDEETLLNEIRILKDFSHKKDGASTEPPTHTTPSNVLQLISSGLANVVATNSNVLVLNRLMICTLKQMECQIEERLQNNLYEQEKVNQTLRNQTQDPKPIKYASILRCGMPYFTTSCGWVQPKNKHTQIQESNGCCPPLTHFQPIYQWSQADNAKLRNLVYQFDKEMKLTKLEERIKKIKETGGCFSKWQGLQEELTAVRSGKNQKISPDIDWLRVAASFPPDVSPLDCESQWLQIVSPEVNQKPWSVKETLKLQEIAKNYKNQDWPKIANELGTNRSPLACCYKFQRSSSAEPTPWLPDEDERLRRLLYHYGSSGRVVSKVSMVNIERTCNEVRARCVKLRKQKILPQKELSKKLFPVLPSSLESQIRGMKSSYKRLCKKDGIAYQTDIALLQSVAIHKSKWDLICKEVSILDENTAKSHYRKLIRVLKMTLDILGRSNQSKNSVDLLSVLEILQQPNSLPELCVLDRSSVISGFLEILSKMHRNTFGPRYGIPRKAEVALTTARNLKLMSSLLSVQFNPADIQERYEDYVSQGGYSPDKLMSIDSIIEKIIDIPVPDCSTSRGAYFIPPNLLTLVGARALLTSRELLHRQSTLPLTKINGTVINKSIPAEERLSLGEAKERFKSRMQTLFLLSITISKFSPDCSPSASAFIPPKKKPLSKPPSRSRKRKFMSELSNVRWSKKASTAGTSKVD